MVKDDISCVPTITEDLLKKAGVSLQGILFTLTTSGLSEEEVELKKNSNNVWTDENELWTPEKHDLTISGTLVVTDLSQFLGPAQKGRYGDKACGIVPRGAEIGFALQWISTCRDLKTNAFTMSGCILPDPPKKTGARGLRYRFEHTFPAGTIKGALTLSIFAYVKKAAETVQDDERMFMNEMGYMFSPFIDTAKYAFQPDVVPFPIKEVSDPGKPLWWLEIHEKEIDDPAVEMFQESNVSICINKASPGFDALLLKKNRATLITVHTDIVATAYFLIVKYLQGHPECPNFWPKMMTGEGLERNTIAEVIGRFLRESEINTEGVSDTLLYQRISEEMKKRLAE